MAMIGLVLIFFAFRSGFGTDPGPPAKISEKHPRTFYAKPRQRIKGFRYDGYDGANHLLSITSRNLTISRKKLGFVRFGLMKEAILEDGHITFFHTTDPQIKQITKMGAGANIAAAVDGPVPDDTIIKKALGLMISRDKSSTRLAGFKGVSAIIVRPVKIELYKDKQITLSISALSAVFSPVNGKIIFTKRVVIISGNRKLMLDRVELNPENSLLTGTNYVFYSSGVKQTQGRRITTDFSLQKGL